VLLCAWREGRDKKRERGRGKRQRKREGEEIRPTTGLEEYIRREKE